MFISRNAVEFYYFTAFFVCRLIMLNAINHLQYVAIMFLLRDFIQLSMDKISIKNILLVSRIYYKLVACVSLFDLQQNHIN